MELKIGTRGSRLALAQTRWVARRLEEAQPGLVCREVDVYKRQGVASSTKFIMKVEAPEAPEETETEAQPEAPKLTLWQRIKNLFGLG